MKILIAEDDEVLAREIQMACTRWGFTVDTVQDFQQIAETLAQLKPDLLLLDTMTAFTGVKPSADVPCFRFCSYPAGIRIRIKSWR